MARNQEAPIGKSRDCPLYDFAQARILTVSTTNEQIEWETRQTPLIAEAGISAFIGGLDLSVPYVIKAWREINP